MIYGKPEWRRSLDAPALSFPPAPVSNDPVARLGYLVRQTGEGFATSV
jgi:hypothetical protein